MRLGASFASRTKGARPSRTRDWRPWHCLPRPFLAPILAPILGLFWATSSSNARQRSTATPHTYIACNHPSCPLPLPPLPPYTSMHTSPPAPITNQQPLLVAFFGSSRTLAFIRVPQARLALKLCWPDSFRCATGGARTFARHSARDTPATAPATAPNEAPQRTPALNTRRVGHTRHAGNDVGDTCSAALLGTFFGRRNPRVFRGAVMQMNTAGSTRGRVP